MEVVVPEEELSRQSRAQPETPVTGGHVKVGWKVDWALRWAALGVHYEMYGKDLIPSAELSSKICRALGGTPPEGFNYELFLDEKGEKISKSKGNGLSMEEWLTYASPEQFLKSDVDERSDLYALGIVMYELLTGENPFNTRDAAVVVHLHLNQ